MEALVDAGVHLGFPRRLAEQLVVQTVKGSVAYYEAMPKHFAGMRNQVTSPGGRPPPRSTISRRRASARRSREPSGPPTSARRSSDRARKAATLPIAEADPLRLTLPAAPRAA